MHAYLHVLTPTVRCCTVLLPQEVCVVGGGGGVVCVWGAGGGCVCGEEVCVWGVVWGGGGVCFCSANECLVFLLHIRISNCVRCYLYLELCCV